MSRSDPRLPNVGKNTYAIIEKFLLDNGFIKNLL